jgi:hypothetical protein
MTEVPKATVFTMPVPEPTVATAVLLLLQVPPVFTSVAVLPKQILVTPVVGPGKGLTVMVTNAAQPVLSV